MRYTVGPELVEDPYHVDIIKEKLTRTLPVIMPDIIDELELAVPHCINAQGEGEQYRSMITHLLTTRRMDCCECHDNHAATRCACKQSCVRWRSYM